VAIFLFLFKFSQSFLSLATYEPVVTRWINYLLWGFGLLASVSVFSLEFLTENGIWVIPVINSLLIAGGLLTFFAAVRTWKHQPFIVVFYFTAFGFLLIGYMIMNLSEFGIIPIEDMLVNPVLIGSSIEILIFSIALTFQMRKIYQERNRLSVSLARQQKELLRAYVDGVEKERERIARELHDDIGSRLGSLKRFLDNSAHSAALQNQIDILCTDVRNMSHQLSPQALKIAGLRQLVTDLAETTQQHTGIAVSAQFYDWPEELPEETAHHLFRIAQEAVNNAVKHAGATEIDLQFFNHENELVVTIDDNGKGFDLQKHAGGIGLKNIRARAESLQASFEISSTPGQGTSLLIKDVRLAL
jgi:signal transduction histidine kinase